MNSDVSFNHRPSVSGFTLIELLVIISILGLLASIVVGAIFNVYRESTSAACHADYKSVESAQEVFKADTGAYATTATQLLGTAPALSGGVAGPWLKELPGNTSHYMISIDGTVGHVGSIMVSSVNPVHAPADGDANCVYA